MAVNYDSLLNIYATNRDAQKNIAQNAMNEQIANYEAAFAKQDAAAQASRDAKYKTIDDSWNRGNDQVNQTAGKALQESYVNSQMQQRNLGQQLAAAGRQGGMAESTMLGLANDYGKVRGGHETTRANSLADLLLARNTDRNAASGAYEDWRANAAATQADNINKLRAQFALQVQQAEQDYYNQQAELMLQQQQEAAAAAAAASRARSSGGGGGGNDNDGNLGGNIVSQEEWAQMTPAQRAALVRQRSGTTDVFSKNTTNNTSMKAAIATAGYR